MAPTLRGMGSATSSQSSDVRFSLEGDWVKMDRLISYLASRNSSKVKRDLALAQKEYLKTFKKTLIKGLVTGGSGINQHWAPHSSNYYSPTGMVGIRTGKYLYALSALRITQNNFKVSLEFGSSLNVRSTNRGLSLNKYAAIFEYGTRSGSQPPRSLWGGTFLYLGGRKGVAKNLTSRMSQSLRRMGIRGVL